MKPKYILLWIFLFFGLMGIAQQKENFKKLVEQTNYYLGNYDKLEFLGSDAFHSIKEFKLSKIDLQEITRQSDGEKVFSMKRDSISNDKLYSFFLEKISLHFDKIFSHKDFEKYDLVALMKNYIDILKSEDNKLYTFSIDEKTGGSYRSRISFVYHTEIKDQWKWDMGGNNEIFHNDGYDKIYTLKTESDETLYVLEGSVRGCGTCIGMYIDVVKIENNNYVKDFAYDLQMRSGSGGFEYDANKKTIHVEYQTDDLTRDCYCGSYSEYEHDFNKKCECVFMFNGTTFELIKESWEKITEE